MSRPLNEYPKEELEVLKSLLSKDFLSGTYHQMWLGRVKEAISDRELADKELHFKRPETSKDELLSKFSPNMVNMVREDATSNKVFMCLLRGDSPHSLIEQLLTIQIDLINDLGEANLKRPIQYIVNNASGLPFKTTEQKHGK